MLLAKAVSNCVGHKLLSYVFPTAAQCVTDVLPPVAYPVTFDCLNAWFAFQQNEPQQTVQDNDPTDLEASV